MPPPARDDAGNIHLPFVDLMKLEKINEVTYRSIAQPFSPGGNHPKSHRRAYGGHVYAQAAWAAAQTVPEGMVLHDVTGWFILAGLTTVPFVYKVHTIRDGRSYCTRIVNVTQAEGKGVCFTCTCSFKLAETSVLDVQAKVDLWETYSAVLRDKSPRDFEDVPGMDVPWYWDMQKRTGFNDMFPGLECKKVDMKAYNEPRRGLERRQLIFYRAVGDLDSPSERSGGGVVRNPNLHLCAHLYASDRNSLFIVANHLDVGEMYTQMGSLMHTVVFHAPVGEMMFLPPTTTTASVGREGRLQENWFAKEDWTTRAADGRGMFHSRVWAPDGTHVATLMQDGMIRVGKKPESKI